MAQKMKLDELNDLFSRDINFELTDELYEERVGRSLPKSKQAITGKNTPLRRKADEHGFRIHVEERPVIQRVVIFTKEENIQ